MAKGNLLLGTAANSVGDVVMYRREGAQVTRVRVRKIANPKTNAQSSQRAGFAPVAKFYSPLATVLERAWEGKNRSQSYSAFLKENIRKARANEWLLPKGTGFYPLPYQLTNGTLPTLDAELSEDGTIDLPISTSESAFTHMGQVSSAIMAKGYSKGDVITLIGIVEDKDDSGVAYYYPVYTNFILNDDSASDLTAVGRGWRVIGTFATGGRARFEYKSSLVACAMCITRFDNNVWRRSKQSLIVNSRLTIAVDEGKAAAIASYGPAAGNADPMVYLDGDNLV